MVVFMFYSKDPSSKGCDSENCCQETKGKLTDYLVFLYHFVKVTRTILIRWQRFLTMCTFQMTFRVGPLDGDVKYEVSAVREGYIFTEMAEKFGHFQSFKLAEIAVEVSQFYAVNHC